MKQKLVIMLLGVCMAFSCTFALAACNDTPTADSGDPVITPGDDDTPTTPGEDTPTTPNPDENASQGLEFTLNPDQTSYSVIGIGTCTDTEIVIPSEYEGLPVVAISFYNDPNDPNFSTTDAEQMGKVTSVIIPDGVTSIGSYAFFYNFSNLTNITLPGSITSIGSGAFAGCSSLTSITIPDGVTSIGWYAFVSCSSLTNIALPDNITSVGYGVFADTAYYKDESNWENGVLYLGNCLIQARTTLSGEYSVKQDAKTIADWAFHNCESLTDITIPDSVINIGDEIFYNCNGMKSVTIGDGVTSIDNGMFLMCSSLESVTVGRGVANIEENAFRSCSSLASINVSDNNASYASQDGILYNKEKTQIIYVPGAIQGEVSIPDSVTEIKEAAFSGRSNITNIELPNSITSIGDGAFSGCEKLTSMTIPDSVTSIGERVFDNCSNFSSINVSANNAKFASQDGILYNKDKTQFIYIPKAIQGEITIPSSVASIEDYTFRGSSNLGSVTIGDGVESIGSYAFFDCSSLESVMIGNSVTSIEEGAFQNCSNLAIITIPDSVTSMQASSFLKTAYFNDNNNWENNVLYIGNHLISVGDRNNFSGTYIIKDGTKTIAGCAFQYCYDLTSVVIPDSVTSIGENAFHNCSRLESVTLGNGIITIGNDAFSYCSNLASIAIPDSVTTIGSSAFQDCSNLINITIPDSVTSIWYGAFYNSAYYNDESNWKNDVLYIGNHLIKARDTLSGAYEIKNGTKTIANETFDHCTNLISITIPDSVTSIGESVFLGCDNLTSVTFENTEGWSVEGWDGQINNIDVTDPAQNVVYFTDTYRLNVWTRSE